MTRTTAAVLLAIAALAAACGGAGTAASEGDAVPPAVGMCLEGVPDCVDTVVVDDEDAPGDGETVDEAAVLRDAELLLGEREEDVLATWADVRVGRHGDESMMLTEDHLVGRKTIATEDDGTGTYRVVEVTVELTDSIQVIDGAG